ncbi:hypothetical protein SAMN05216482_1099 [Streptomyces sp. PAN_FS17]|nr:hypothetical protein SAMN05216482_1099 [Streptomyces sp. PAN_FS17]
MRRHPCVVIASRCSRLRQVRGTWTPDHLHDLRRLLRVRPQAYRPGRRFTLDHQRADGDSPHFAERRWAGAEVAQVCRQRAQPSPRPAGLPLKRASGLHPAEAVPAPIARPGGSDREEDCFPCRRTGSCLPRAPGHEYRPDHRADERTEPGQHPRSKAGGKLIAKGCGARLIWPPSPLTSSCTLSGWDVESGWLIMVGSLPILTYYRPAWPGTAAVWPEQGARTEASPGRPTPRLRPEGFPVRGRIHRRPGTSPAARPADPQRTAQRPDHHDAPG